MILKAYGEQIQCDKAVKDTDSIKAFLDGVPVLEDSGISDFNGYTLTDERGNPISFGEPEPKADDITQLQLALSEMGDVLDSILIEQLTEKGMILND